MLATLLGHRLTNLQNVPIALSIYDEIRRPIAMKVVEGSIVNGRLFGLQLPGVQFDQEPERLPELGDAIKENWGWCRSCLDSPSQAQYSLPCFNSLEYDRRNLRYRSYQEVRIESRAITKTTSKVFASANHLVRQPEPSF
jgi:hypothetical protein